MENRIYKFIQLGFLIFELLIFNAVIHLTFFNSTVGVYDPFGSEVSLWFVFNVVWLTSILINRTYLVKNLERSISLVSSGTRTIVTFIAFILSYLVFVKTIYFSEQLLFQTFLLITLCIIGFRLAFRFCVFTFMPNGIEAKNVVILGQGAIANDLNSFFKTKRILGYSLKKRFDDPTRDSDTYIKELSNYCHENKVEEIYYASNFMSKEFMRKIIDFADNNLIRFRFALDYQGYLRGNTSLEYYDQTPVFTYRKEPLEHLSNRVIKRIFDIFFSSIVILLIYPIMFPVLAVLIKLSSPGPVLFVQDRSGRNNETFRCYKFRTMTVNTNSNSTQATKNDARVTRLGAFLRKTSLDEFPQFLNVLIGNMSVVGPRPHMLQHTEDYGKIVNRFMVRHLVKPGISGHAQVCGFRGNTENDEAMEGRVKHDVYYLENWSLLFDLKIVFYTVYNIFKGEENAF